MSLTPSAIGTSPKFDAQILKGIQISHVEFGGAPSGVLREGWEGAGVRVL